MDKISRQGQELTKNLDLFTCLIQRIGTMFPMVLFAKCLTLRNY